MKILGVDMGTTGLKMGVFESGDDQVHLIRQFSESYPINSYNNGLFADIEQDKWLSAFRNGCAFLKNEIADVDVISLSGTTPGLTAMDENGNALYPAILMLDQRSRKQAKFIIDTIGLDYLLTHTGNMPVAGGCSLASMLWIKENLPKIYKKTYKFGHSNTFVGCWLTGVFAMDPSSASLSAVYNTAKNDLSWHTPIAEACNISENLLPELIHAADSIGHVKQKLSDQLGFRHPPAVLIGGNDAVLAAYSAGIQSPGDIINVNGTSEITLVCLPRCMTSQHYNVRAHVLPDLWLTLHVMNAGGKSWEWFRNLFCKDMNENTFYNTFVPDSIDEWLQKESHVEYVPFLMGSRYSLKPLNAEFKGLTVETTRSELFAALLKGLCTYQRSHLQEIATSVQLEKKIHVTGGALNDSIIEAKRRWFQDGDYVHVEQSSLRGAALLALLQI